MIKYPEGGTQEIPNPQTMSEPKHNPRGAPIRVTGISDTGFWESSGDPSGSTSDKPTKHPFPVPIINPSSGSSEITKNFLPTCQRSCQVPNQATCSLHSQVEIQQVLQAPCQLQKVSSNPRAQTSSDPDVLNQGSQEAKLSMKIYLIIFILHIISSSSSSQRDTQTRWQGSMRISQIGVRETCALFSITSSWIYNKDKHEKVKVIPFE